MVATNDLVCGVLVTEVPKLKLPGFDVSWPSVVPLVVPPTPETAMDADCGVPRPRKDLRDKAALPLTAMLPLRFPVAFGAKSTLKFKL